MFLRKGSSRKTWHTHTHLTDRPMNVIRLQPLLEQAGYSRARKASQLQAARTCDSFSSCNAMFGHTDPLIYHAASLSHRNLFPELRKLKGLCKTSVSQPTQVNPFQSTNPDFWDLPWALIKAFRERHLSSLMHHYITEAAISSMSQHGKPSD